MAFRFYTLILLSFISLPLLSQISPRAAEKKFTHWTDGTVVLNTGDTVQCELSYNQMVSEGLLHVKDGETVLTLSVKEVKHFSFFDEKQQQMKRFYTLPIQMEEPNLRRDFFLELIYANDKVAIVNHKFIKVIVHSDYYGVTSHRNPLPEDYHYLLKLDTHEIFVLNRQNALLLTNDKSEVIKQFVKASRIKFRKIEEYIRVFEFYRMQ